MTDDLFAPLGQRRIVSANGVDFELWESGAQSTLLPGGQRSPADDVPMILPLASDVNLADHSDIQRHHWL